VRTLLLKEGGCWLLFTSSCCEIATQHHAGSLGASCCRFLPPWSCLPQVYCCVVSLLVQVLAEGTATAESNTRHAAYPLLWLRK
jgi:hypothetical protein